MESSYVNSAQLSSPHNSPAWLRFALFCTLFILAAIWVEPHLNPLCRVTALQVSALLDLVGLATKVQGDLIKLPGFAVRIVPECTSLYACLLYGAFVLAQSSTWKRTLSGLIAGIAVISSVNLLRISFVTALGPLVSPMMFDIIHVYLGQVTMLSLVVGAALIWQRWITGGPSPLPFLLMVLIIATILFIPWVIVNRVYLALLDNLVASLYAFLYPGFKLITPRPLAIYNHTFAIPFFLALIIAKDTPLTWHRLAASIGGVCAIASCHTLFRVSHVVFTAQNTPEILPFHQGIYLLGQFLLPLMIWLWIENRSIRQA